MGRCAEGTLILSHDPGAAQRLRPASPKWNDESTQGRGSGAGRNKGEEEGT